MEQIADRFGFINNRLKRQQEKEKEAFFPFSLRPVKELKEKFTIKTFRSMSIRLWMAGKQATHFFASLSKLQV